MSSVRPANARARSASLECCSSSRRPQPVPTASRSLRAASATTVVSSPSLQRGIRAGELERLGGISIVDDREADAQRVGELELRIRAGDPVFVAAFIHFVGDADEVRVQILVEARHRRAEQQRGQ